MDAQLRRGLLEVCVLSALSRGDSYGYRIIRDVSVCVEISESTLYPILKRLEGDGCLTVYSVEHNSRLRKMYSLTPLGEKRIEDFLESWKQLTVIYDYIREGRKE